MNTHNVKLRPHHLLCTQSYAGKGYNDEFTQNMTLITTRLRNDPNAVIDVVFSTDDICAKCPKMAGGDLCESNEKVKRSDQKVIGYFGIQEKSYHYHTVTQEINTKTTAAIKHDICGNCEWYKTLCLF